MQIVVYMHHAKPSGEKVGWGELAWEKKKLGKKILEKKKEKPSRIRSGFPQEPTKPAGMTGYLVSTRAII